MESGGLRRRGRLSGEGREGGDKIKGGEEKLGQNHLTLLAPLDLDRAWFFLFLHRLVFVVCDSHDFSTTFAMLQLLWCLLQESCPLYIYLSGDNEGSRPLSFVWSAGRSPQPIVAPGSLDITKDHSQGVGRQGLRYSSRKRQGLRSLRTATCHSSLSPPGGFWLYT